mmetsp:Transcript_17978/g.35139  ORF Transcript_17978/g.35139 Transcript_17978/m.35139 type:complete len:264 (-) Transcript_17978:830-1621(-)
MVDRQRCTQVYKFDPVLELGVMNQQRLNTPICPLLFVGVVLVLEVPLHVGRGVASPRIVALVLAEPLELGHSEDLASLVLPFLSSEPAVFDAGESDHERYVGSGDSERICKEVFYPLEHVKVVPLAGRHGPQVGAFNLEFFGCPVNGNVRHQEPSCLSKLQVLGVNIEVLAGSSRDKVVEGVSEASSRDDSFALNNRAIEQLHSCHRVVFVRDYLGDRCFDKHLSAVAFDCLTKVEVHLFWASKRVSTSHERETNIDSRCHEE